MTERDQNTENELDEANFIIHIKLLIDSYRAKVENISKMLDTDIDSDNIDYEKRQERLITKQSEYRTFIIELERIIISSLNS